MPFAASLGWGGWAYLVAQTLMLPLLFLVPLLLRLLGKPPEIQDLIVQYVRPERAWHPWAIAIFGILVAPVVEEVIFRGLLHPAVRSLAGGGRRGAWIAAVVVSALFAAVHGSWTAALPLFVLAMVLTWVFERTNSLVAPAAAHVLNNALTLLPLPWLMS
jgi:membrane protease YdiL (CAAX protease family)